MPSATFNGAIVAHTDAPERVGGRVYFPPESVAFAYLTPSTHRTRCMWKGEAHYYHVVVGDRRVDNGAWYYPTPKKRAAHIKNHVAFWKDIEVQK